MVALASVGQVDKVCEALLINKRWMELQAMVRPSTRQCISAAKRLWCTSSLRSQVLFRDPHMP